MNTSESLIHMAARAAHEVNRAYCLRTGDTVPCLWRHAGVAHIASMLAGARAIAENPELGPEQGHVNWLAIKRAEGWAYGPVKDEGNKEHPCFRPYADLPPAQRAKDLIFGAVVRGVLGYEGDNTWTMAAPSS